MNSFNNSKAEPDHDSKTEEGIEANEGVAIPLNIGIKADRTLRTPLGPANILRLHKTVGNRTVTRILQRVRNANPPGTRSEREGAVARNSVQRFLQVKATVIQRLVEGDTGETVKQLQTNLNKVNAANPPLVIDGIFGPKTAAAVKNFQKSLGKPETGKTNIEFMENLLDKADEIEAGTGTEDESTPATATPAATPEAATPATTTAAATPSAATPSATPAAAPAATPGADALENVLNKDLTDEQVKPFVAGAVTTIEGKDEAARDGLITRMETNLKSRPGTIVAPIIAAMILRVPADVTDKAKSRTEAYRILQVMLSDVTIALTTMKKKVTVIIVPQGKLMTDLPEFSRLKGQAVMGRTDTWDAVRGSGGMENGGRIVTAITEENLLGITATATHAGKTVQCYDKGYSTTSHEFAHTLHLNSMSAAQKTIITDAYIARKSSSDSHPDDANQWVDGKKGCYASYNEQEFFAQLANCYLGSNGGKDPYTGDNRKNTKAWVETNEPKVYDLLKTLFGESGSLPDTNPRAP